MVNFKEKKVEAIERMKLMELMPRVVDEFEKSDIVNYSEGKGYLYWLSNKPEWEEFTKEFEQKYNTLVYHAELSHFEFGTCLTLFYVSNHREEWEQDREDLKDGYSICYVWNIDDPVCSEFGTISFEKMNGGVRRTG